MKQNIKLLFASHSQDAKPYSPQRIRKEFDISGRLTNNKTNIVYSLFNRFITGGTVTRDLAFNVKSDYFSGGREPDIIYEGNSGGAFEVDYKEALYIVKKVNRVVFKQKEARFYYNSVSAYTTYSSNTVKGAEVVAPEELKNHE